MKTIPMRSVRRKTLSNNCGQSIPVLRVYSPASPLRCEQCGEEIFGETVETESGIFCCNLCVMEARTRQRMAEDNHWSSVFRKFYGTNLF
jgi:late competence protein required for DNA uptake (superfamily II DNA/RNA helicase)